jgi:hypothetical protein
MANYGIGHCCAPALAHGRDGGDAAFDARCQPAREHRFLQRCGFSVALSRGLTLFSKGIVAGWF